MECNTVRFTVAEFCGKRGAFDAPAEFQRQGDAWSREKKQLFLDTLFSGYDASKFYLQVLKADSGMRDWQAQFLGVNLDVVMIRGAEEADIGAMFMRLNNGESVMRV